MLAFPSSFLQCTNSFKFPFLQLRASPKQISDPYSTILTPLCRFRNSDFPSYAPTYLPRHVLHSSTPITHSPILVQRSHPLRVGTMPWAFHSQRKQASDYISESTCRCDVLNERLVYTAHPHIQIRKLRTTISYDLTNTMPLMALVFLRDVLVLAAHTTYQILCTASGCHFFSSHALMSSP